LSTKSFAQNTKTFGSAEIAWPYVESDSQKVESRPTTQEVFFSKKSESELTFVKNEKGEVTGFLVTRDDKLLRVKKIK